MTLRFLFRFTWLGIFLSVMPAIPADASDMIVSLGVNDFDQSRPDDRATLGFEYQSDPFYRIGSVDMSLAAAVVAHGNGDFWVGAGLGLMAPLENRWFIEASFMPGFFNAASLSTDIGSDFEFRSMLGVGRWISSDVSVSLALSHKSNAGISDVNPGVNAVLLRVRKRF